MEDLADKISDLVKRAVKDHLSEKANLGLPFLDADDYKAKTGRRFRMTPKQIEAGLTREEAFQEFVQKMMSK